ncbi:MAG: ASKHA domain-containing protein, partial [Treponema sp.]|nr:ASKHA domain-containing protein [Treponema sp.]
MPQITFLPGNITIDMPAGSSLLEGARRAGVFVETPCGGKGTCQKCHVRIIKGDTVSKCDTVSKGDTVNKGNTVSEGVYDDVKDVLICQTTVPEHHITVELAANTGGEGQFENFEYPSKYLPEKREPFLKKINLQVTPPAMLDGLSDADRFSKAFMKAIKCNTVNLTLPVLTVLPEKLRSADGKILVHYFVSNNIANIVDISCEKAYGIAVDIGTTTVALWLVDIESGKVLAAHNAYNGQVECGLDVISRINYAKKSLSELQRRILQTINELTVTACKETGITSNNILCVSLAGNTTMTHLLLGIIPEYIRLAPYTPAVFIPPTYTAGQLGINIGENAPVLFAPAVGSYVGGDITSGLLCTGLAANSDELVLFIDIGTNGEIVLGNRDFIFACACSAGPAFEGGGIKHGVRARVGAIERVLIDNTGKPEIHTIGNAPPIGICGSGIISAIAELFRKGI